VPTYKVLGQSSPSAASLTTAYTVPSATAAVVSTITVANRSATATAFRIAVRPGGASIADEHYVAYDVALSGNSVVALTLGLTLATTDVVSVYATLATLSFGVYGTEI
jgi:glucose-6-phosphate dehydrogenase assembly protein OpcA